MKKILKDNSGVMIVEATFVFPIMFFTLFMLLFMGNVYYQQAKLNSVVDVAAINGAAYCADPQLEVIQANNRVPTENDDIKPYRYLFGLSEVETKIKKSVEKQYKEAGNGFFASMSPTSITCDADFHNNIIMYTFSVEATYNITVPLRFMGTEPPVIVSLSSKATAPVNDNGEFINNLDMAIDYYESSGLKAKVSEATNKIKDFFSKFGKK